MKNQELLEKLSGILAMLSEDEYPESCSIIAANMDVDSGEVYDDAFGIASQLYGADETKQMTKCVADFVLGCYEENVAAGDADAACDIGALYYTGRCGKQSYDKAMHYYTIAADGGCRQAQENLGYCYYYGRDTAVDYEKAFHYFALGAFDGHIGSLYKIGDMYRNGYYVKKDEKEAFCIYTRCMETMTEEAVRFVGADVMLRMGDCYFEGIGTGIDNQAALYYYQKAENLFYDRLQEGDFLVRGSYEKAIERQSATRKKLRESLPNYEWTR